MSCVSYTCIFYMCVSTDALSVGLISGGNAQDHLSFTETLVFQHFAEKGCFFLYLFLNQLR